MSGKETAPSDSTLPLDRPVSLPEVLDMLIVGGGPAGTAAAFHARELGLSALVIDYDDLMKRIRDYSKDKPILPSFAGGDRMQFPRGGELVSELQFAPIDKDEMCASWKDKYRRFAIPSRIGLELVGLDLGGDSASPVWEATLWNHRSEQEENIKTRHVVLAVGRGVPRRFDIDGNTDGIAFKLTDPAHYVGEPAVVIGGGTSAAEAVVAISHQKREAEDSSAVYWSYRGNEMPKVSRALAGALSSAYAENGNIRYLPKSEPTSVITGRDAREYVCVRTDRRAQPGLPAEATYLEFPKKTCLACIGEEVPEALLSALHIPLVAGGPKNKKRIVITPLHETSQPNVYLIGDILSPVHHSTQSFDDDPSTFEEVKRRGNIKAALRDGVFVTEVIAQKLAGRTEVHVHLDFEDGPEQALPEPSAPPASSSVAPGSARLVRLLKGGVEAEEFPLRADGVTTIGRYGCDISFPDDVLLSDKHASLEAHKDGFLLHDERSRNGVFLQAAEGKTLSVDPGAIVKVGAQWLVFGKGSRRNSVSHHDAKGKKLERIALGEGTVVLGRDAPDITLDPDDKTLSRRHLAISSSHGAIYIRDLKSNNGTFLKLNEDRALEDGDHILVGSQTLRYATDEPKTLNDVSLSISRPLISPSEKGPEVRFDGIGKSFSIEPGQTICELAEAKGVKIRAECRRGLCGSDPIRVVTGGENLQPMSDEEAMTLEDICGLDPGEHRLACLARVRGAVSVEILD